MNEMDHRALSPIPGANAVEFLLENCDRGHTRKRSSRVFTRIAGHTRSRARGEYREPGGPRNHCRTHFRDIASAGAAGRLRAALQSPILNSGYLLGNSFRWSPRRTGCSSWDCCWSGWRILFCVYLCSLARAQPMESILGHGGLAFNAQCPCDPARFGIGRNMNTEPVGWMRRPAVARDPCHCEL
jgi:hypothetical protein